MRSNRIAAISSALGVLCLLTAAPALAQETEQDTAQAAQEGPVQVSRAVVATGVQDREPLGAAESFGADVGTLYFYTVLEGDFPESSFAHVWLHDGTEVARVQLTARGPRWRTWSSKEIAPDWTGDWEVQLVNPAGEVLETASFTVQ